LVESSTRRIKENIEEIPDPIEKLMKLKVVKYNRINSSEIEFGLIAEDVNEIYPELVDKNDNGISGIKYTRLTALLLESIKILKNKIDEHEITINKLLK
jgi:uncharacterized UPF0160 family protein